MIGGIRLKVCGLTRADDAQKAAELGADWLGFIFHEGSPRKTTLGDYRAFKAGLPGIGRVAVSVEPDESALDELQAAGFDAYQIHFRRETPLARIDAWSRQVGRDRLWLAPKLAPSDAFDAAWLRSAAVFLLDGYDPAKFGGTGRTTDWSRFAALSRAHPGTGWILSGGINPANAAEAVSRTGAGFIDVNSGVELAPGIKDPAKLAALVRALPRAPEAGA